MEKWEKRGSNLSLVLAKSLKEPILGKHFSLPGRNCRQQQTIELDTSQSYIAVYTHLKVHAAEMPDRLPTPEHLGRRSVAAEGKPKNRAYKNNYQANRY